MSGESGKQSTSATAGMEQQDPNLASFLLWKSQQTREEKEKIRKTPRTNAGVPPGRHGDYVPTVSRQHRKSHLQSTSQEEDPDQEQEEVDKPPSNNDRKSIRSGGSASSSLRRAEIDEKVIDLVEQLEKEHRDKQRNLCHMERDLANMQIEVEVKKKAVTDNQGVKEHEETLANLEKQMVSLTEDIARATINIRFEGEDISAKVLKIRQSGEVEKQKVNARANSVIDDLDEIDKEKSIEEWANNSRDWEGEEQDDPEDLEPESREKVKPTPKPKSRGQKTRGHVDGPVSNNQFEEFTKCMVEAMSKVGNPSVPTSTFLARQVQGRELPIFSGRPEEWPAFLTAYQNSTHNCGFSNADNLPRLQKCLKGDALRTVQCMLINPDSVPKAIDKLEKRFGKPEVIIKSLITKVRECPPVRPDRIESLVEFGLAVEDLTSTIISLNSNEHLANPMLLDDLIKKLPVQHQFDWIRFVKANSNKSKNLQLFAEWLSSITEAAYELCPPKPHQEVKQERRGNRPERVHVAKEETDGRKQQQIRTCTCCIKPGHRIQDCRSFAAKPANDTVDMAKLKRLCFGCLNGGHSIKDCRSKKPCGISNCKRLHHKLLHQDDQSESNQPSNQPEKKSDEEVAESVKMTRNSTGINHMVIPVYLKGPNRREKSFVVLDNYSTVTTMVEKMANNLGAEGESKPLTITGFNSTATHPSRSVAVTIQSSSEEFECQLTNVRTVQRLDLAKQSLRKEDIRKWKHLCNLNLETYENVQPTMIIGLDNHHLFIQDEFRVGKNRNAPAAVKTPLGWVVIGKLDAYQKQEFSFHIREEVDDDLHQLVKYFFTTESFGVKVNSDKPRSREDVRAQQILDKTMKRVYQGWETGLLWKDEEVQLPESKSLALSRLGTMERKMDRDSQFAQQYQQRIAEYVEKGFARKLSEEEAAIQTPKTFYMPHFMAYNPKKPNKYRFVFDAAAKTHGKSLNNFLLQGPDKLAPLPGVLMKFRQRPIAITADIRDMFHRVKVRQEDAVAHRFLWRGMSRDRDPDTYQMNVLIFGAACSPVCAQEAKNRNALDFKEDFPAAYEAVVNRHYVDDYLDSCSSVPVAIQRYKEVLEIQQKGDFHLCNWLSNSIEVMEQIPENIRSKSAKNLDVENTERVLGLFWIPPEDKFTFSLAYLKATEALLKGNKIPTKRELLSLVMSLYDPLGFLATFTVKAKMMIQSAWRTGVNWEDPVPKEVEEDWKAWVLELKKIPDFRLTRCYSTNFHDADEIQLHIFGDASQEAFGAVAYFVVKKDGHVDTALVLAKSKVSPLKILTIPRLELQAAVMGSRMSQFIHQQLEEKITKTVLWTDSTTVLDWIRSESRRFQQFVSNRIGEIQELTDVQQWKWLPTEENVADELTRKSIPCDWNPSSRWINGPTWLKLPEEQWPVERSRNKKEEVPLAEEISNQHLMKIHESIPLLDLARFSSWSKLIRSTVYVFRFIRHRIMRLPLRRSYLTIKELAEAEIYWIKTAQAQSYPEELEDLVANQPISKTSRLRNLHIYVDNYGVIRIHSRLQNATAIRRETKAPAVLEAHHPICRLLIQYYHNICGHHGHERIGNEIRQKYWIIGLRAAVRKARIDCQKCKNVKAKPTNPLMGQLPDFRVQAHIFPFQNTGLDYFGPIEVVEKRSRVKRYVALFTCLSTRAIHLELANSLNTDSCILAIRRFVGRRGCPTRIQSDNGTNFHGAANELKAALRELDQQQLTNLCTSQGIQWKFNCPAAPNMGGSWERMVRSVKVALGAALQMKTLTDEVLYTLLVEAEHTVNSHPLTHVADDPEDPEALTPNHFLLGRSSNLQPTGDFSKGDLVGRKHWRATQHMADCFWRRWVREYLPTLLRREKWYQHSKPIQVGDVVVEVNEALKRNSWPKGIVVKTYPGQDNIVRVVDIRLGNGHIHKRPVSRLCVLDVQPTSSKVISASTAPSSDIAEVNMGGSNVAV